MWEVDNANVPAPTLGPGESTIQSGELVDSHQVRRLHRSLRDALSSPQPRRQRAHDSGQRDTGGLDATRWRSAGSPGRSAEVKVYDGNGDRLIATVTPFPEFEGALSVAMGDVNDDNVLDLIVGAGENYAPMVVAYSGKAMGGNAAFETQLARFAAFDLSARGGVSVTATQIDGTTADNIIVGSGPGIAKRSPSIRHGAARVAGHGAGALLDLQPLRKRSARG